eukprot:jgi/Botrbrau1/16791/Bobra.150_2s0020.1
MVVQVNGKRGAGNPDRHGSTDVASAAAYARDLGLSPGEGSTFNFRGTLGSSSNLHVQDRNNSFIGQSQHGEEAYHRRAVLELLFFASQGDLKRCQKLHKDFLKDLSKTDIQDYDKRTPLHLAASEGCFSVTEWLLQNDAPVNALDRWGRTPLEDAIRACHKETAAKIKAAGGKIYEDGNLVELEKSRLAGATVLPPPESIFILEADWEIDPADLDFGDKTKTKLGEGEFGVVYKALWHGTCVAAKQLKVTTEFAIGDFRTEVDVLRMVHHPNAVQFLGACTKKEPYILVTELMHGGSLADAFRDRRNITLRRALEISIDCARGLAYMHANKQGAIIHRDLKPGNLMIAGSQYMQRDALVTNIGTCKLADFGLSKSLPKQDKHVNCDLNHRFNLTGETGSYRYMAPEVFTHDMYNKQVDVYSFAMIMYQLFEGRPPFADMDPVEAARLAAMTFHRPDLFKLNNADSDIMRELRDLVVRCWATTPEERPEFEEIVAILAGILKRVPREPTRLVQGNERGGGGGCCSLS